MFLAFQGFRVFFAVVYGELRLIALQWFIGLLGVGTHGDSWCFTATTSAATITHTTTSSSSTLQHTSSSSAAVRWSDAFMPQSR